MTGVARFSPQATAGQPLLLKACSFMLCELGFPHLLNGLKDNLRIKGEEGCEVLNRVQHWDSWELWPWEAWEMLCGACF